MFDFFSSNRRLRHRLLYPLLSITVTLGLLLGTPIVSRAIPLGDLILQGIQVIQLSNISDSREVALGKEINQQITRQVRIYRDPAITQYVDQIGQRLAARSGRPKIPYTFQVVDDNSVNAFATMGGFVYVHTGLLKLADNEAQLASVMGHEIGHIVGRHSIEQAREIAIARGLATAAGLNRGTLVNLGVELALRLPNSRKDEYEADQLGLVNMGKAGYAQSETIAFMQKLLNQQKGGGGPQFLKTHPDTANRIARLKQALGPNSESGIGLDSAAYKAKIKTLR
jgi:beta-barrel assembly-enhancing protease